MKETQRYLCKRESYRGERQRVGQERYKKDRIENNGDARFGVEALQIVGHTPKPNPGPTLGQTMDTS
jgi:hypothetical protein